MMLLRRLQPGMICSLALSVLVHAVVLVPLWMQSMMHTPQRAQAMQPPPVPRNEPPKLGLDAPNPSSLTWIGYEEYEEHLAALAEIEQAAFAQETGQPTEVPPATPQQNQPLVDEPTPAEAPETLPVDEPVEPEVESTAPETTEVTEVDEQVEPPAEVSAPVEQEVIAVPQQREARDIPWVRTLLDSLVLSRQSGEPGEAAPPTQPQREQPTDDAPSDAEREAEHDAASATEQAKDEQDESSDAQPSPEGAPPGDATATPSDRESDATSTIKAEREHWRQGKPLAAQGAELLSRKPNFTLLQRMTASPGNPLVRISFAENGRPESASIVESSGSASVDAAIEASLYRWRAEGEAIEELEGEETFEVTIRIILNRRAQR